jgi:GNAT superfamily N-acetyltransferase
MEIIYRFLNAGSDAEIQQWLELYRICYQHSVSREYWHWIHMGNPFYKKTKPLILIAEINSRIVGSVSIIPSPLQVTPDQNHCTLDSCLICKAMVHPEYQQRGIFSSLLNNAIQQAKDENYDLLITFSNNPYSYQSFVDAGFTYVTEIIQSKYYLSADGPLKKKIGWIASIFGKTIGFPLSIRTQFIPAIHPTLRTDYRDATECCWEIDRISASPRASSGVYGVRTLPFIRWRFSYPGFNFKCLSLWEGDQMLAYLIIEYQERGKNAIIVDIFIRNNDEFLILTLVSELVTILEEGHFNSLQTYFIARNESVLDYFSLWHGFINRSLVSDKQTQLRFLCYPLKENLGNVNFSEKNQWTIQSADTCMFWAK